MEHLSSVIGAMLYGETNESVADNHPINGSQIKESFSDPILSQVWAWVKQHAPVDGEGNVVFKNAYELFGADIAMDKVPGWAGSVFHVGISDENNACATAIRSVARGRVDGFVICSKRDGEFNTLFNWSGDLKRWRQVPLSSDVYGLDYSLLTKDVVSLVDGGGYDTVYVYNFSKLNLNMDYSIWKPKIDRADAQYGVITPEKCVKIAADNRARYTRYVTKVRSAKVLDPKEIEEVTNKIQAIISRQIAMADSMVKDVDWAFGNRDAIGETNWNIAKVLELFPKYGALLSNTDTGNPGQFDDTTQLKTLFSDILKYADLAEDELSKLGF